MDRLGWKEFWPFYLGEHRHNTNRVLHFVGTTLAFLCLVAALATQAWWWLVGAALGGYAFAWVGHFAFEKNRPATFRYPLKSLAMDWRLWALTLTGRVRRTYERHGLS